MMITAMNPFRGVRGIGGSPIRHRWRGTSPPAHPAVPRRLRSIRLRPRSSVQRCWSTRLTCSAGPPGGSALRACTACPARVRSRGA